MSSGSSSGHNGGKPPDAAPGKTPRATLDPTPGRPDTNPVAGKSSAAGAAAQVAARTTGTRQDKVVSANAWDPTAAPIPQTTIPCPKCGAAVREVARFCQRCHMTMRFECPSCGNKQRTGVKCEKCGINFVKYIGAVVAAKQTEADTIQAKLDRRSAFLKNIFAIPFTGGLSLFKQLFSATNRKS